VESYNEAFVGLDVSKSRNAVAVANCGREGGPPHQGTNVRSYDRIRTCRDSVSVQVHPSAADVVNPLQTVSFGTVKFLPECDTAAKVSLFK
jgi:hypothetical protein